MPDPEITWETLAPLLRGRWSDDAHAFECLVVTCERYFQRVIAREHRRWERTTLECGDLVSEVLVELVAKARREGGLTWQPEQKPAAWFFRVISNKARDVLRRRTSGFAGEPVADGDEPPAEPGGAIQDEGAARRIQAREDLAHVARAVKDNRVPPSQLLGFVLLRVPDALHRELLERLAAWPARGHKAFTSGLVRDVDEAWALLEEWRERHADFPDGDASRLELAWILRSQDRTSPEAWRRSHPEDAARARDLLRSWDRHARAHLDAWRKQ